MDKKVRLAATACFVLLLGIGLVFYLGSNIAAPAGGATTTTAQECQAEPRFRTVEIDYYVVAGVDTASPPLPPPEPSPHGFTFTFQNETDRSIMTGVDFGSVCIDPDILAHPECTNVVGVIVNITNQLGYDIVIQDLTANTTAGTRTLPYWFVYSVPPPPDPSAYWGNFTMVQWDSLDRSWDEVNYYTGDITFCTEIDPMCMADEGIAHENHPGFNGTPFGIDIEGVFGEYSLLEPDANGDAKATGHVKPCLLQAGGTFTEYFGVWVGGNATSGMEVRGTITLRLYYKPVIIHLHGPCLIDPRDPQGWIGTDWEELCPDPTKEYQLTSFKDTTPPVGQLNTSDQVDLTDPYGNKSWWHVENVAVTLRVSNASGYFYIESELSWYWFPFIGPPVSTQWIRVCTCGEVRYHLDLWYDGQSPGQPGYGNLSVCDTIWLSLKDSEGNIIPGTQFEVHVDEMCTDLVLKEKICEATVEIGMPGFWRTSDMKWCATPVTKAYQSWTMKIEVTVKNVGTIVINCQNVSLYYHSGTSWVKIGTSQTVTNLGFWGTQVLTWNWDLANVPPCRKKPPCQVADTGVRTLWVTSNCTCEQEMMCFGLEATSQLKVCMKGDVNANGAVDVMDMLALKIMVTLAQGMAVNPLGDVDGNCAVNVMDMLSLKILVTLGVPC